MRDLTAQIIDYEQGILDAHETIDLFAELIRSGLAWQLQGHYGRMAVSLMEAGFIDPQGNVLNYLDEEE